MLVRIFLTRRQTWVGRCQSNISESFLKHATSVVSHSPGPKIFYLYYLKADAIHMPPSPVHSELQPFSVSSALQAAAGAAAAETGSGLAVTFAAPTAPSGEQVASRVRAAAAVGPKTMLMERGIFKKQTVAETHTEREREKRQDNKSMEKQIGGQIEKKSKGKK